MKWGTAYFAARGWLLLVPFLIVLGARAFSHAPLRPEWLIYVVFAAALRLWAGAHLGEHGNASRPEAARLTRTGPYRSSRNPLYIANIFTAAGLIFFANALPLAAELGLVLVVIAHHLFLVCHEEPVLRALHGAAYEEYAATVPRWWGMARPKSFRTPMAGAESDRVSLQTALRRQSRNLLYALVCVVALWIAGIAARGN